MPSETKVRPTNHGHGHRQTTSNPTNRRPVNKAPHSQRTNMAAQAANHTAAKQNAKPQEEKHEEAFLTESVAEERDIAPPKTSESPEDDLDGQRETDDGKVNGERAEESPRKPEYQKGAEYKKSSVTPDNFNVHEFNTNLTEFVRTLEDPRYSFVDNEYPVDELVKVVTMVTSSVKDYRSHAQQATEQLEELRSAMRTIKENLHFSVSREAVHLSSEGDQTQEEKDLLARLTKLNADLAQANADVTEAIRLATETESAAVKADIMAEKGREEAQRLQEEIEKREQYEQQRHEEEKRRMAEERTKKEEEEKRTRDELKKKEEEWSRREALQNDRSTNVFDAWEPVRYETTNRNGDTEVTCIARGQPGAFSRNDVKIELANEKEQMVTYLPHEELISRVLDLTPVNGTEELKTPIYVAIPYILSRSGGQSREAVVKALTEGQWQDLPTQDVSFDSHKETKFAQAEVRHLTTLLVMSRLKRDYSTLEPGRSHKLTSSCDQRITFTVEPKTFGIREHFMLQVQPIDSVIFQEFRTRFPQGKTLLTSSPIVHTQWESCSLLKPVTVTIPCPPNPAKARKMALARKLKEEKMKMPKRAIEVPIDFMNKESEKEKERQKEQKRMQQFDNTEESQPAKPTKWYMGNYANLDDDESDRLYFVYQIGRKWRIEPDLRIKQVKVDLLSFNLEFPVEKFVILRTRPSVDEDEALALVSGLDDFLGKRFVEAVVRQRSDDPFQVVVQVTPVIRREAVVSQLAQSGFESGPAPSSVLCLREGDQLEVGFSGNIEAAAVTHDGGRDVDDSASPPLIVYKSNVPTLAYFTVQEENQFRQKDHEFFSGLIVLTRKFVDSSKSSVVRKPQVQGHEGEEDANVNEPVWLRERLCALQINIPKYHIEPNRAPVKAPVSTSREMENRVLVYLAQELGDEWRRLAHYLGIRRARIQSIMRNITVGEKEEKEAKYEMLLTWLKNATKSSDKLSTLSNALAHSGRPDLADAILDSGFGTKANLLERKISNISTGSGCGFRSAEPASSHRVTPIY